MALSSCSSRSRHALARLIVLDGTEADIRNLWEGFYPVRVSVLAVRQPYRTRPDGVKVGATARGMPVELCVHRSAMTCQWSTWVVEREIGHAELVGAAPLCQLRRRAETAPRRRGLKLASSPPGRGGVVRPMGDTSRFCRVSV